MKLQYGKKYLEFTPFENVAWTVLDPERGMSFPDEKDIIQSGIQNLIKQLKTVVKPNDSVLCIVPDHTRKCRLPQVLPLLLNKFKKQLGVEPEFLVANGSHVLQPDSVIEELVGKTLYKEISITQHDAKDDKALTYLGKTTFDTEIYLNSKVVQADHIITIGGILYHYFAGFGGGPKMLLPGVAGYETIRQNHSRTIDPETGLYHSECYEGNIDTNPVYLDLKQALNYFDNIISLQFALDTDGKIVVAETGPVLEIQRLVCETVKKLYTVPFEQNADIIVASAGGFPADVNLVQSHKAIYHAFQAVKSGGIIIVLAQCPEGAGSATFTPYFEQPTALDIGMQLLEDYKINGHTALSLKSKASDARIILVSELDKKQVEKTGMIPVSSVSDAVKIALQWLKGKDNKGYILPLANLYKPEKVI